MLVGGKFKRWLVNPLNMLKKIVCGRHPGTSILWQRCFAAAGTDPRPSQVGLEHLTGDDTGISVLTLKRPEARNALGIQLVDELGITVAAIADNWKTRCLLIKSAVPDIFCAGSTAWWSSICNVCLPRREGARCWELLCSECVQETE